MEKHSLPSMAAAEEESARFALLFLCSSTRADLRAAGLGLGLGPRSGPGPRRGAALRNSA